MIRGCTLRPITAKHLGSNTFTTYPANTLCKWQRRPNAPGQFVLWFTTRIYAVVNAIDMPDTVRANVQPEFDWADFDARR